MSAVQLAMLLLPILQLTGAGYGFALLQLVTALGAVVMLSWVVSRFFGRGSVLARRTSAHVTVLDRLALEPQRVLYLVRVADRVLLLGTGEGGQLSAVAEFDADSFPEAPLPASLPAPSLWDYLRIRGRVPDGSVNGLFPDTRAARGPGPAQRAGGALADLDSSGDTESQQR